MHNIFIMHYVSSLLPSSCDFVVSKVRKNKNNYFWTMFNFINIVPNLT